MNLGAVILNEYNCLANGQTRWRLDELRNELCEAYRLIGEGRRHKRAVWPAVQVFAVLPLFAAAT